MTFQNGDFLVIEYTGKVKETGEVFDTTNEEIAKKANFYKAGETYEPKLVVVGEGWILKPLDESLLAMEMDKPSSIEIPPEKAFGERDPNKIRRVPLRNLVNKGIELRVGKLVEFDNKFAVIRAIGAGRVLLDFNPPLAGKTLVYEVNINKHLKNDEEKVIEIIHRRIPVVEKEKFKFVIKDDNITIKVPEEAFYLEGIQVAKRGIALDLQKFFQKLSMINFNEIYSNPKKEEANIEKPTSEKSEDNAKAKINEETKKEDNKTP